MARVVVVASYAPSLTNFRGHLLSQMVSIGHTVTAVAPDASRGLRDQLGAMGVDYFDIGAARTSGNPLKDFRYLLRLRQLFLRLRPDVVFSYTIKPNIYASIAARLATSARIFALVTGLGFAFEEASDGRSFSRSIARALLRRALTGCDGVIVQNPDDLEDLVRTGVLTEPGKAAIVNGSGVDLEVFGCQPLPDGPPAFLLIARLLASKGIQEYAEAARRVRVRAPNAQFHLVGWFDDNPAALARSKVEDWVREGILEYHGAVDDVRPYLTACHVYVLPSYREGTPRTVLEAMATGRAIITTDVAGCRQTVTDGQNGYLVPPKDSASLACAIMKFVADPGLARTMGAESRRMVERKYDVRLVSKEILSLMSLD